MRSFFRPQLRHVVEMNSIHLICGRRVDARRALAAGAAAALALQAFEQISSDLAGEDVAILVRLTLSRQRRVIFLLS